MAALFGTERAEQLSEELKKMNSSEREATIVNELTVALKSFGHRYVLPFCFKNIRGKRTTHHLVFVSKHFKGYEVMKGVMAKASSEEHQGVPSFNYSPAASRRQQFLFELNRPIDDLKEMLLSEFAGKEITMREIYETHSVDTPFIARNYKEVLAKLEQAGAVQTMGRKSTRGFADYLKVLFP